MAIQLGDEAPNFTAETTEGPIDFHEYLGNGWGVLFSHPADFTPELSRRARGVEVWAALRSLGREGLARMIERNCEQARRFADQLSAAGFEILNDVVLNQVLVSFGSAEKTQRVIALAEEIATATNADPTAAARAAELSKADLTTDMVKELTDGGSADHPS